MCLDAQNCDCDEMGTFNLTKAPHPFNKFMKVKDIHVDTKPNIMNIAETAAGELRLFLDNGNGIRMYDFHNSTIEEISAPGVSLDQLGAPVDSVLMASSVVACYTSMLLIDCRHGNHSNS